MNKYIKILVIFLFASLGVFLMYNKLNKKEINILSIGDDLSLGRTPFNTYGKSYNYYFSRSINANYNDAASYINLTYEELYKKTYYDTEIYSNGEFINIKNAIREANAIIITASNNKSFKKCSKNNRIFIEYLENNFEYITKIIDQISNISTSQIIILTPYCSLYNKEINDYIEKYYVYKNAIFINIYKGIHLKSYYVPNSYNPYPSLEGYNYIYNEIRKEVQIN